MHLFKLSAMESPIYTTFSRLNENAAIRNRAGIQVLLTFD